MRVTDLEHHLATTPLLGVHDQIGRPTLFSCTHILEMPPRRTACQEIAERLNPGLARVRVVTHDRLAPMLR